MGVAALGMAAMALAPAGVGARTQIATGVSYQAWGSDLDRGGYDASIPLSLLYQAPKGRFLLKASTAFVTGHYHRDDLGIGGSDFRGNRLTDSTLGFATAFPTGKFKSSAALNLNLPTGDTKWERYQSEGNVPLVFASTRYRGRGFGASALYGLGRDMGAVSLTAALGYLFSGSTDPGLLGGKELDMGNYTLGSLIFSHKDGWRLRASLSLPQASKVAGLATFKAPMSTGLEAHWATGLDTRLSLTAGLTLYGKAQRADPSGNLAPEAVKSYGSRLELAPVLEYQAGKARLKSGVNFKKVFANGYASTEPHYEAGGMVVGAAQELQFKVDRALSTRVRLGYDRITHQNAGLDADFNLTDVSYDWLSLGAGVEYQW